MSDNNRGCIVLLGYVCCFGLGLLFAYMTVFQTVESKHPVEPELEIKVIDGVADTTYVYRYPGIGTK